MCAMICDGTRTGVAERDEEAGWYSEEEHIDGEEDMEGSDGDVGGGGVDVEAPKVRKTRKKGTKGKRWNTKEDECLCDGYELVNPKRKVMM